MEASDEPIIFDARKHLHASGQWDYNNTRTVLIAWTVIHARNLSTELHCQLVDAGFPVPSLADLDKDVPHDWQPNHGHARSKRPRLHQQTLQFPRSTDNNNEPGLKLEGNVIVHQVD